MDRIRLPFADVALSLLTACQSAPTAPVAPRQPGAPAAANADSSSTGTARGGWLAGSGN